MPNDNNLKSHFNLHLIVFIWGFTAILGALISIKEVALVWYRMGLATLFLMIYLLITKKSIRLPKKVILNLFFVGFLLALHWIFFFRAINIANVSITLAMFSLGSFFAAILEPIFFNRKIKGYELAFGLIIIIALYFILQVEVQFLNGIFSALFSIIVGVIFTLLNGKLIQKHDATIIATYEFFAGFLFVTIYLLFNQQFTPQFFQLSTKDWLLILILSSICTAYAFTASINVMKRLSPYTVMLTTNLEPVYGIALAYFILGSSEHMSPSFYIGAIIILITVIANGYFKSKE
jgi:drug/metabolite transporter (DMT)-like permease